MDVIDFIGFIDSFNKRVFIVKIDIEGGEIELVNQLIDKGAHEKIDYLFVETHERKTPELLPSTLQLKKRIKQLGIKNIYLNWT